MSQIDIIHLLKTNKGNKFTAKQIKQILKLNNSGSSRMLSRLRDFKLIKSKLIPTKLKNGIRDIWHYWY